MTRRKGQTLTELGIGIMVLMVVLVAVTIPVADDALQTELTAVNNETFNATSDPFTYTVSSASNNDFKQLDSTGLTCYASTAQSSEIACSLLDAEAGTVNVTGQTGTDAGDESIDYNYQPSGYIESDMARTVLNQIELIIAVAAFLAAISVVR